MHNLSGLSVAVMGGDAREVTLVEYLASAGVKVRIFGLPLRGANITVCDEPEECLTGVQALILPVPGANHNMELYTAYLDYPVIINREMLKLLPPGTPILVGMAREPLRELVYETGLNLVELMKLDEVAILNSIPSAEGAIMMAMERMSITIHGCKALVYGLGRTGLTLANLLLAMHAETTVVARSPAQLARAMTLGLRAVNFQESANYLNNVDVIFNTIPAMVINEDVLKELPKGTVIIDLASAPGGTDFVKAGELGIDAVLTPGLPGKVAPKTAGMILTRVVPRILLQHLTP